MLSELLAISNISNCSTRLYHHMVLVAIRQAILHAFGMIWCLCSGTPASHKAARPLTMPAKAVLKVLCELRQTTRQAFQRGSEMRLAVFLIRYNPFHHCYQHTGCLWVHHICPVAQLLKIAVSSDQIHSSSSTILRLRWGTCTSAECVKAEMPL